MSEFFRLIPNSHIIRLTLVFERRTHAQHLLLLSKAMTATPVTRYGRHVGSIFLLSTVIASKSSLLLL